MSTSNTYNAELSAYADQVVMAVARTHGIYCADIWSKRKTPMIAAARRSVARRLRATVWYKGDAVCIQSVGSGTLGAWVAQHVSDWLDEDEAPRVGFKPISYPMLGQLLNLDHSGLVHYARKRRERATADV